MFLDYTEIFLIGSFSIIFLYFITYYFVKGGKKYYLYFALGCLISIIRTITNNLYPTLSSDYDYIRIVAYAECLSYIWGPFIYVLLANSLFPKLERKVITKIFLYTCIALSVFALLVFIPMSLEIIVFDYAIIACIVYASYIFTVAFIKKKEFSIPLFIANIIFIIGIIYDVLYGSKVFVSPFGELHPYTYFAYIYITSIVLAIKHSQIDKKYFESQLNFLHAQIKPHFLYNTINTIRAYSKTDTQKTCELLDYLSTYLRGKYKKGDEIFTPLKDEVALVKAYLSIEQLRFEERLQVEYDIDEHLDIIIPCLILQPIVENAVKHGIAPKLEGGHIYISIKAVDRNIVIIVKDDGVGIDKNRLSEIQSQTETGIGISNTNERLKRYYNTEIEVSSIKGLGTTFTITIPMDGGSKHAKMHNR